MIEQRSNFISCRNSNILLDISITKNIQSWFFEEIGSECIYLECIERMTVARCLLIFLFLEKEKKESREFKWAKHGSWNITAKICITLIDVTDVSFPRRDNNPVATMLLQNALPNFFLSCYSIYASYHIKYAQSHNFYKTELRISHFESRFHLHVFRFQRWSNFIAFFFLNFIDIVH